MNNYLTIKQASELAKIGRSTINLYILRGIIPAQRIGNLWLIERDVVERLRPRKVGRPRIIKNDLGSL